MDSLATSTSMMRLFAASRFCLLMVSISEAKLIWLACAPLDARSVATSSIAVFAFAWLRAAKLAAPVAFVTALARAAWSMFTVVAPSSVVPTAKVVAEAADVKSDTPLNFSADNDVSWAFSAVNSVS